MALPAEQLIIDAQSRFLEMKSLQPYSTTDEYLYAMKEDLAEWLSNMYEDWRPITADNFTECLENGALLCHHANNVNDAARKSSTNSLLINCKYRLDARPGTFTARDNVSQFIKWARRVAGVREVLMFESDDLILRKNEKNFILCLLEIARFGAKFGLSVPVIIKFEQEIEREIQLEQEMEIKRSMQIEQEMQIKRPMQIEQEIQIKRPMQIEQEINDNQTNSTTWTTEIIPKQRLNSQGSENSSSSNDITSTSVRISSTNIEPIENTVNTSDLIANTVDLSEYTVDLTERTVDSIDNCVERGMIETKDMPSTVQMKNEELKPMVAAPSSSQLHKTVVKIVNSCCCSQRFPVIRIGEGKYRIGENGTIIFIRILRNHVMVRVGGGWDTLENYLNKHDPCRKSGGHHRTESAHSHHSDIPILAIPNPNVSLTVQKSTPFGKSVLLKTEEFPLPKPTTHDTNLSDAQLVITRGADGRHRIGQITYKAEDEIKPSVCPHHQTPPKVKSTEQTPSPRSIIEHEPKEDFVQQAMRSLENRPIRYSPLKNVTPPRLSIPIERTPIRRVPPPKFDINKANITESIIGSIDNCTANNLEQDFDLIDIADAMRSRSDEMDNDSLESNEGIIEEKPIRKTSTPKKPTNLNRKTSRSTTISNLIESTRQKPMIVSHHRSQSTEILHKQQVDMSKLDRDSGFDEQDFRRERLLSNGDDNSSISSVRTSSRPSSVARSNYVVEYKENKSYELRMKKLEEKRKSLTKDSPITPRKLSISSTTTTRRTSETAPPISMTNRYRKNSQTNINTKK